VEPFTLFLLLLATFSLEREHAVFNGDFDVLFPHFGQFRLDEVLPFCFADVNGWHPVGHREIFLPAVA